MHVLPPKQRFNRGHMAWWEGEGGTPKRRFVPNSVVRSIRQKKKKGAVLFAHLQLSSSPPPSLWFSSQDRKHVFIANQKRNKKKKRKETKRDDDFISVIFQPTKSYTIASHRHTRNNSSSKKRISTYIFLDPSYSRKSGQKKTGKKKKTKKEANKRTALGANCNGLRAMLG